LYDDEEEPAAKATNNTTELSAGWLASFDRNSSPRTPEAQLSFDVQSWNVVALVIQLSQW